MRASACSSRIHVSRSVISCCNRWLILPAELLVIEGRTVRSNCWMRLPVVELELYDDHLLKQ